jgi:hypothetical protein
MRMSKSRTPQIATKYRSWAAAVRLDQGVSSSKFATITYFPPTKRRRLSSARFLGQDFSRRKDPRARASERCSTPRSELNRRPLVSWYSDAAMSGRRIRRVLAQAPYRPSFSRDSRTRTKQKSENRNQWTDRRSDPQGSARMPGITLSFLWRSERCRKRT